MQMQIRIISRHPEVSIYTCIKEQANERKLRYDQSFQRFYSFHLSTSFVTLYASKRGTKCPQTKAECADGKRQFFLPAVQIPDPF